jgi:predicted transcriptional regulator
MAYDDSLCLTCDIRPAILYGGRCTTSGISEQEACTVLFGKEMSMGEASQTIRQKVHALAEELPADASWDDVMEEARFRKAVELGIAAADRGSFATEEEMRNAFARWGVKA